MHLTNKNTCAPTPPMGWNSYDYYDTTVDEAAVKANADYMAKHLKAYGWEYIVVDIQWYAKKAGSMRDRYQYIPFSELEMDEYSRLLPDPERFPSSADGSGFKPLADYVHSLGLKFGIHIMRGIPRIAAHHHGKIKISFIVTKPHIKEEYLLLCEGTPRKAVQLFQLGFQFRAGRILFLIFHRSIPPVLLHCFPHCGKPYKVLP